MPDDDALNAAALADEQAAHAITQQLLASALERLSAAEVEQADAIDEAHAQCDTLSAKLQSALERAERAEAALRRERNDSATRAAMEESDVAYATLSRSGTIWGGCMDWWPRK